MPKPNMYQSLHTTLIGPKGQPFEIQIRTYDMHRTAEYGIAAHWKYKEGGSSKTDSEEKKMSWLRQILEWQRDMSDNKEFLSLLKSDLDLFSDSVYCFTPSGDVKTLPNGSTPIDFAYSIHSAVGNKMVGARVNGSLVTIDYKVKNGDRIEILTSQNSKGPSRDWLSIVKSTQAKNKINQWFKTEFKEENIIHGKELLYAYCKPRNINPSDILKTEYMQICMQKYGFRDWESVYAAIGHGGLKESQVVNKLLDIIAKKEKKVISNKQVLDILGEVKEKTKINKNKKVKSGIIVEGMHDLAVRFSKCCSPVPGDEIIGFITRGRGVSIHRTDCVNMIHLPESERIRLIEAEWNNDVFGKAKELYAVEIVIFCDDRSGLLLDVSKTFAENDVDIKTMNIRTAKQEKATITVGFETRGKEQLDVLVKKLYQIEGVYDIDRTSNG